MYGYQNEEVYYRNSPDYLSERKTVIICRAYIAIIIHASNDDCDIQRQLNAIIIRANILIRTLSKCSPGVKLHLLHKTERPNLLSHIF